MVLGLYQLPGKATRACCLHFGIQLWHGKIHETVLKSPVSPCISALVFLYLMIPSWLVVDRARRRKWRSDRRMDSSKLDAKCVPHRYLTSWYGYHKPLGKVFSVLVATVHFSTVYLPTVHALLRRSSKMANQGFFEQCVSSTDQITYFCLSYRKASGGTEQLYMILRWILLPSHLLHFTLSVSGMFSIHFNPQSASKPDHKFGFVIFRTTYGDEYSWDRFMIYLNAQARARMIEDGYADQIPNLDWNVQSSPDLEFASFEEIRK
jgi:hypothetical protein